MVLNGGESTGSVFWNNVSLEVRAWLWRKSKEMPKGKRSVKAVLEDLVQKAMLEEETQQKEELKQK